MLGVVEFGPADGAGQAAARQVEDEDIAGVDGIDDGVPPVRAILSTCGASLFR
jgi:hypothetical protein